MRKIDTAPGKMKVMLILCLVGTVISIGSIFFIYTISRNAAQTVGKDTVPSIIAAQNIKATLANAHSNAMNAMVTKEKPGGKFWGLYRSDMNALHSQLVDASKNISYGDEERLPILSIASNISTYEYTVGGAVADVEKISVDQFMEANRLMQQKILPASTALNKVNISQLDSVYDNYSKNANLMIAVMVLIGLIFIVILAGTQFHLFKKTRRVFNLGLLTATILFSANLIYSIGALNSVKADLNTAKHDAFDSINALWNARAVAYNAKSLESLYLLHQGTGIVQTADTINFNLASDRLCSDPKAAESGGKFEGYLNDALSNITFAGEEDTANTALQQWIKYVEVDKRVRNLEYDSKHSEAIALSVGDEAGQSGYEFERFDAALGETININQTNFDSSIDSAFKTLKNIPYVISGFFVLIIVTCILGMKSRMDEYKV